MKLTETGGMVQYLTMGFFRYKAHQVIPTTQEQLKGLSELSAEPGISLLSPLSLGRPTTIVVSPEIEPKVKAFCSKSNLSYVTTLQDVGE